MQAKQTKPRVLDEYPMYEIYPDGRVVNRKRGTALSPQVSKLGRTYVRIVNKDKQVKSPYIAVLLAKAFIKNHKPVNYNSVLILDGNSGNLELTNLMWGTHQQAIQLAIKRGTWNTEARRQLTSRPYCAKLTLPGVRRIWKLHKKGVPASKIAKEFGVVPETIYSIIKGRTWKDIYAEFNP